FQDAPWNGDCKCLVVHLDDVLGLTQSYPVPDFQFRGRGLAVCCSEHRHEMPLTSLVFWHKWVSFRECNCPTGGRVRSNRSGLVSGYARMWPREIFDKRDGGELLARRLTFFRQPGVYILYRDEHPYYIGKTGRSAIQENSLPRCTPSSQVLQLLESVLGICG